MVGFRQIGKQFWWLGCSVLAALMVWLQPGVLNHSALAFPAQKEQSPAVFSRPTEIAVHLGTSDGQLQFVPDRLQFSVGQRYKLVLDNPSSQKHYFTAKDFADAIWTQKVEAGNVEVKGAIHELELKPGAIAQWVFIPQKPGTYSLRCTIAGHAEAGMVGEIAIAP